LQTQIKLDDIDKKLLELCDCNTELYLVGGYVRDILLFNENISQSAFKQAFLDKDYVVIGESAIDFAKKTASSLGGHFVLLDETHDIARVVTKDKKTSLDFAGCVGKNINDDLKNRDFSINAAACKLSKNSEFSPIIDVTGAVENIKNKKINTISFSNLIDDPLRMLRAFRFAAQFGFEIDENILKFIKENKNLIKNVAVERISQELIKLLEADFAGKNLLLMSQTGFLDEILPELTPQRKVPSNLHHHLGLLEHSIESVIQLENRLLFVDNWVIEHLNRELSQGIKAVTLLKLAGLLHDIAKPETWTIDEEGRHRFIKHEEIGSITVMKVLKRLKFSKASSNYVSKLIKYHMYPSQLLNDGLENLSEKAMMRMFRRIGEEMPELLLIAMADRLSARGVEITEEIVNANINGLIFFLQKFKEIRETVKDIPKLIDGNEVMKILGISPSPQLGKILSALHEAQISGDISSRDEALEFIKKY